MSYTQAAGMGITAAAGAYSSGILAEAQAESSAMIQNAMMEHKRVAQDINNRAADRNAREATNIVAMNELFATAEAQEQKVSIRLEALTQAGKASALYNISGIKGATVDRVTKQITESAALAEGSVDDSVEKQQLNFLLQRGAIEAKRQAGQQSSLFIDQAGYTGNPMIAGITAGLGAGLQTYAKFSNDTTKET